MEREISSPGRKLSAVLKKNAMLVILVLVYLFFMVTTSGNIFKPANFKALIDQNAYVYILGVGMLMCMLTGGNIDLSVGSFVCLLGAIGGLMMINLGVGTGPAIVLMLIMRIGQVMSLGYEKVYLMQAGTNTSVSEIISTWVYKPGLQKGQFSYATAVGLFNSVVNLALLLAANTVSKKLSNTSMF